MGYFKTNGNYLHTFGPSVIRRKQKEEKHYIWLWQLLLSTIKSFTSAFSEVRISWSRFLILRNLNARQVRLSNWRFKHVNATHVNNLILFAERNDFLWLGSIEKTSPGATLKANYEVSHLYHHVWHIINHKTYIYVMYNSTYVSIRVDLPTNQSSSDLLIDVCTSINQFINGTQWLNNQKSSQLTILSWSRNRKFNYVISIKSL